MSVACNELELTEIPTISSSESVNSLDVSHNILTQIKEFIFEDYSILENLILSDNAIERIDSRAFNGLKMLINIDLSYNNLQFITPTMFSDTPLLQTVSFRRNPLVYVPDKSPLLVSPSVTSLDLSYCDLTSANRHTFSQLPALQVLDLNSNKLQEFNRDILNTLTEISVIDFGNNLWKCDCNIVQVLNWLSARRRSKGLSEEHKPVECFDAGVLKTIWSSTSKNELCSEQAELLPNASTLKATLASSESTTDTKVSTHTPTTSQSKKEMKDISTVGSGRVGLLSWDINTLLFFVILCVLLGVTTFVTLVAVHFVTNWMKFKRNREVSSYLDKSAGKLKGIFSGKPLNLSLVSSGLLIENHSSVLGTSFGSGSYTDDCDHTYETVE
jgi:Leucine-rich repeat (LRR) protein